MHLHTWPTAISGELERQLASSGELLSEESEESDDVKSTQTTSEVSDASLGFRMPHINAISGVHLAIPDIARTRDFPSAVAAKGEIDANSFAKETDASFIPRPLFRLQKSARSKREARRVDFRWIVGRATRYCLSHSFQARLLIQARLRHR